ncbi:MAG: fatty acid desaturase [Candidatus Omnitrophica bacterium]|nr:fatty acid desaturase [Candidatus Omnitrophota bacterium]
MGVAFALLLIGAWAVHLWFCLVFVELDFSRAFLYVHVYLQSYLCIGLFITAHDAMHHSLSTRRRVNRVIGAVALFLYAALSFRRLLKFHGRHHAHPGSDRDPDFCTETQNPLMWWGRFLGRYMTWTQFLTMASLFFLLSALFGPGRVITFWMIPAFLGSFQLFFFGTYLPHRLPHTERMRPYNARSFPRNHLCAMLTCYFFGYHHEHHRSPRVPWWRLYRLKGKQSRRDSGN